MHAVALFTDGLTSGRMLQPLIAVAGTITALLTVFQLIRKLFVKVGEGEVAIRINRAGKVVRDKNDMPKIVGPGLRCRYWGFYDLRVVSVQQRNDLLDEFEAGDPQRKFKAGITWRIMSHGDMPYRATFGMLNDDDLTQQVRSVVAEALRRVCEEQSEQVKNMLPQYVTQLAAERCIERLDAIGVELLQVNLGGTGLTLGQMLKGAASGPSGPSIAAVVAA